MIVGQPTFEHLSYFQVALVVFGIVLLACIAHGVMHKFVRYSEINNDVPGIILTIIGTLYAVLLGFTVIVVWQEFENSDAMNLNEVTTAASIYELANGFPDPVRSNLQNEVSQYVSWVVTHDFPAMAKGRDDPRGRDFTSAIARTIIGFRPKNSALAVVQGQTIDLQRALVTGREARLHANERGLPGLLWVILVLGMIIVLGMSFLLDLGNFKLQLLLTASLAAIIALNLVLIREIDFPFRGGPMSLSCEHWVKISRVVLKLPRVAEMDAAQCNK